MLINGDRSDDITVEAGDVIVVGPAEQFVNLSGEVKRPAIYETLANESLNDLIRYGLGFTDIANRTNLSLRFWILNLLQLENLNRQLGFNIK